MEHRQHHRTPFEKICDFISIATYFLGPYPLWILLFTIALMPCLYSSGAPWWLPSVTLLISLSLALWLICLWWRGRRAGRIRELYAQVLFIIPIIMGLIHLIPSRKLIEYLSPAWHGLLEKFSSLTVNHDWEGTFCTAVSPDGTLLRICALFACWSLYVVLCNRIENKDHLKILMSAIVLAALSNTCVAFVDFFSKTNVSSYVMHGAFMNRNHFAFFTMMGIITTVGLMAVIHSEPYRDTIKGDELKFEWHKLIKPLFAILLILLISLLMSLSRGAVISTMVAFGVFALIWLFSNSDLEGTRRTKIILMTIFGLIVLSIALPFVTDRLSERFDQATLGLDGSSNGRLIIWSLSTRLLKDYWRAGTGAGGYGNIIQSYDTGAFPEEAIVHAHNDYLEFACEYGVPVAVLMVILFLIYWFRGTFRIFRTKDKTRFWAGITASCCILGCAIHEFVDFNLLAWPNAIIFAAIMCLLTKSSHHDMSRWNPDDFEETEEEVKRRHLGRYRFRLVFLAGAVLIVALTPAFLRRIRSGYAQKELYNILVNDVKKKPNQKGLWMYKQHQLLVNSTKSAWPEDAVVLRQTANVKLLQAEAELPSTAQKIWPEICQNILASLRREPMNVTTVLECAYYFERAFDMRALSDPTIDIHAIMELYEWAVANQPKMLQTLSFASDAAHKYYIQSAIHSRPDENYFFDLDKQLCWRLLGLGKLKNSKGMPITTNKNVYQRLVDLGVSLEEMLANVPDVLNAQLSLIDLYFSRERYDLALQLATDIENRKGDKMSAKMLSKVLSVECAILEMQGDHATRTEKLNKLIAIHGQTFPIEEINTLISKGNCRNVDQELNSLHNHYAQYPIFALKNAKMCFMLGEQNNLVAALMPLTYKDLKTISVTDINEALKLLGNSFKGKSEEWAAKWQFVHAALMIQLAEHSELDVSELPFLIQTLKDLETSKDIVSTQYHPGWLQAHLIPYYEARANILLHQNDVALADIQRCLAICPNHLPSIKVIEKIAPETLTDEQKRLLSLVGEREPISQLTSALIWLNVTPSLPVITKELDMQTMSLVFLCTGDPETSYTPRIIFEDSDGPFFSDTFRFKRGEDLTLRVGELCEAAYRCQPMIKSLTYKRGFHRVINNGNVAIRLSGASVPMAKSLAFKVDIQQ